MPLSKTLINPADDFQSTAAMDASGAARSKIHLISKRQLFTTFLLVSILMTLFHLDLVNGRIFREHGSESYGLIAESLATNGILAEDGVMPTAMRPPLYPLLLAAIFELTGDLQAAYPVHSLLAGLMLGGLAAISYLYTGKSWPALVVILLYIYLDQIPIENITQRDTLLFSFLLVASCAAFIYQDRNYCWWKLLIFGFLMGLAALVRPLAIAGPFFACIWVWRLRRSKSLNVAEIISRLAIFLITFYLVLLPWGIRNYIAIQQFTISSTTAGLNLWKGNNPGAADFYPFLDVDVLDDLLKEQPAEPGWWDRLRNIPGLTEAQQNISLRQIALDYILEHPQRFLEFGLLKVYTLWLPQYTPLGDGEVEWTPTGAEVKEFEPNRSPIAPYLLLYLLAGIGVWHLRNTSYNMFFITWLVFLSLVVFATFGESRFRYPLDVLALPLAAVGCWVVVNSRRRKLTDLYGVLPATKPYPGKEIVRTEVGRHLGE